MGYAELHCLTNFSFLRGASHPEELVERAAELGYAALAVTDECSVAGAVRAHGAARERGLKLLVGSELRIDDGPRLVLLACNRRGYGQLCRLITRGRRAAGKGSYRLVRADFGGIDVVAAPAPVRRDAGGVRRIAGRGPASSRSPILALSEASPRAAIRRGRPTRRTEPEIAGREPASTKRVSGSDSKRVPGGIPANPTRDLTGGIPAWMTGGRPTTVSS